MIRKFTKIGVILGFSLNSVLSQAQIVQNFSYTGSMQTFTVPSGVCNISISGYGGSGANGLSNGINTGGQGGLGATVSGVLNVTAGNTIYIFVGGAANGTIGGFNGGGNGGGGGGGASDIRINGINPSDRVFVAAGGGGGGAGGNYNGSGGVSDSYGGSFSGNGGISNAGSNGGFGATSTVGGLRGIGCSSFYGLNGSNGDINGIGGGGGRPGLCCDATGIGGGGGGGFVGGGGGGGATPGTTGCGLNGSGGGGGGSQGTNYLAPSGLNYAFQNNVWSGNGKITIMYEIASITGQSSLETVCGSALVDLYIDAQGSNLTYLWSSGNSGDEASLGAGIYTVTVSGTCSNIISEPITVSGFDNTQIQSFAQTAIECPGDFTSILVSATGKNLTYVWNTGQLVNEIITSTSGNYMVTVSGLCGSDISNSLTLQTLTNCNTTSINEVDKYEDTFSIYPNPTDGSFVVSGINYGKLEILDLLGKVVYAQEINTTYTQINANLLSGMYLAKIGAKTQKMVVK